MTEDDKLHAAWMAFSIALRDNERAKIKREWIILDRRHSALEDMSQCRDWDAALNYQRMMVNIPPQQYSQTRGLVSGPLSFLGL